MDVIRELLLFIENDEGTLYIQDFEDVEFADENQTIYHLQLLIEADYIIGFHEKDAGGRVYILAIERLTWQGHEFLDAIRDKSIWDKVKKTVGKFGSQVPIAVITELSKIGIKEAVGLIPHQ